MQLDDCNFWVVENIYSERPVLSFSIKWSPEFSRQPLSPMGHNSTLAGISDYV